MFLETLDVRKNDVLIYSKNKFDFDSNFKIIFKKEPVKRARNISYFEVCEFIKDPTPKNLIVYRLLTNVAELDSYSTKYGYFIRIEGKMELIYFDPIFAVKDLRHLRFNVDPEKFRFKVQQLGLTFRGKMELEANFAEVFSFDLKADESKYQNDKIFADAIFALDNNFIDEEDDLLSTSYSESSGFLREDFQHRSLKNVVEDSNYAKKDMSKITIVDAFRAESLRERNILGLKKALGVNIDNSNSYKRFFDKSNQFANEKLNMEKQKSFSEFIKNHHEPADNIEENIPLGNVIDLFKSAEKTFDLSKRDEVYLKFENN